MSTNDEDTAPLDPAKFIKSKASLKPPSKSTMRTVAEMVVFIGIMQIKFTSKESIQVVQMVFLGVASLLYVLTTGLLSRVTKGEGSDREVWYPKDGAAAPNPLAALMGGSTEPAAIVWEKMTFFELETRLAKKAKVNTITALAMPAIMSIFMNIHYLIASQVSSLAHHEGFDHFLCIFYHYYPTPIHLGM
jgi:hypothetical protein